VLLDKAPEKAPVLVEFIAPLAVTPVQVTTPELLIAPNAVIFPVVKTPLAVRYICSVVLLYQLNVFLLVEAELADDDVRMLEANAQMGSVVASFVEVKLIWFGLEPGVCALVPIYPEGA
jgi:hypothetical protein